MPAIGSYAMASCSANSLSLLNKCGGNNTAKGGHQSRAIKKIPLGRGSQGERGGIMEIALHYLDIIITYIFSSASGKRSFFEVFST
jgi:hypothetical protein